MSKKDERQNTPFFAVCLLIEVYLALLLCLYPLLIKAGYGETSRVKYYFLTGISYAFFLGPVPIPAFVPLAAVVAALGIRKDIQNAKTTFASYVRGIRLSLTDRFVLLYALALILSSLVSSYKEELLWGYPGWNMGLASQFLFVFLYFILSRLFDPEDLAFFVPATMCASTAVFVIGILQRLGQDVFHLYPEGLNRLLFLSTIGQASWFSSYMINFAAIGVFLVWYADQKGWLYKVSVIYLLVTSVCLVTQNTDSAYAGLFFALSMLFVWSFDSAKKMARFLETALIILLGFRVAGFAYTMAGEQAVPLDPLSVFMMHHALWWGVILLLAVCRYLVSDVQGIRNGLDAGKYRVFGKWYAAGLVLTVVLLFVYIVLNTKGILPEALSSTNNYLYFDFAWGNVRGAIIHDTVLSCLAMWKEQPLKGLFGVGADQFYHVIIDYVSDWTGMTSSKVLTNAHNEWLTAFVNFGLFGGIVYAGIFLAHMVRAVQYRKETPLVTGTAACVIAYMVHNLFCYQQYVCTPYIFVIMGIGERLMREKTVAGRNGVFPKGK